MEFKGSIKRSLFMTIVALLVLVLAGCSSTGNGGGTSEQDVAQAYSDAFSAYFQAFSLIDFSVDSDTASNLDGSCAISWDFSENNASGTGDYSFSMTIITCAIPSTGISISGTMSLVYDDVDNDPGTLYPFSESSVASFTLTGSTVSSIFWDINYAATSVDASSYSGTLRVNGTTYTYAELFGA